MRNLPNQSVECGDAEAGAPAAEEAGGMYIEGGHIGPGPMAIVIVLVRDLARPTRLGGHVAMLARAPLDSSSAETTNS